MLHINSESVYKLSSIYSLYLRQKDKEQKLGDMTQGRNRTGERIMDSLCFHKSNAIGNAHCIMQNRQVNENGIIPVRDIDYSLA